MWIFFFFFKKRVKNIDQKSDRLQKYNKGCPRVQACNVVQDDLVPRKHGALRPQKPLRLIRDGEVGGGGVAEFFVSSTYS